MSGLHQTIRPNFIREPAVEDRDRFESHLTFPVPSVMAAELAGGQKAPQMDRLSCRYEMMWRDLPE